MKTITRPRPIRPAIHLHVEFSDGFKIDLPHFSPRAAQIEQRALLERRGKDEEPRVTKAEIITETMQ